MRYDFEELKQMPLFSGIETKKDMDWLFRCVDARMEDYHQGDIIAEEGENLYFAGVVVKGKAFAADREIGKGAFLFLNYSLESGGKFAPAESRITAASDCSVLWLRWIRTVKLCSFECVFHKSVIDHINILREGQSS